MHTLDFYGHGTEPFRTNRIALQAFAEQVYKWLEEKQIGPISIFGYSMGGYVALYLAAKHPEKVTRIFTLATKFDWNEDIGGKGNQNARPGKD